MAFTQDQIVNWIFLILGIVVMYYVVKKHNTIYLAVRDKKNKIHKIAVYSTDDEEEVMRKVNDYMKKNQ